MIPLNYREDPGLDFLRFCNHEDLEPLVEILAKKKGEGRWTASLEGDKDFIRHRSNLPLAWKLIAAELQRFGADSVVSVFRLGKGVHYREILTDVCSQMKIPIADKEAEFAAIELQLLSKVLTDSLEKMSPEEIEAFVQSLGKAADDLGLGPNPARMAPAALAAAVRVAIGTGGFNTYRLAVIVANAVSKAVLNRGLAFAGNAALTRGIAVLAGPIGWAISATLTVPVVSGPAFRVTIPAALYIAYLRQKRLNKDPL